MRAKPLALTLLPPLLAVLCAAPALAEETPETAVPGTAASPAASPTAEAEPSSPAPSPSPSAETPAPSATEASPSPEASEPAATASEDTASEGAADEAADAATAQDEEQKAEEQKADCPEIPQDASAVTQAEAAAFYKAWKAADCTAPAAKAASADPFTTYTEDVTLTADSLTQTGLSYDGVVTLPTSTGSKRLLKFSMKTATLKGLSQTAGGMTLGATEFGFSGSVVMYAASITGKAFGALPMTLTPDSPPPLVLPVMMFTDVTVTGTAVTATTVDVTGLTQR
ncbi:hypothetical protein GCM10022221_56040 [Actinocorallia aurea]